MNIQIAPPDFLENITIKISGSKSETNRLLLLQAIFPQLSIENSSLSDDSMEMEKALTSSGKEINVGHAGTAMRFLTAYFATAEGREIILTGSPRMKQRPIKILVEVLRELGATIEYLEEEGFPPLRIRGRNLNGGEISLDAGISSQYISALMLIAPVLKSGIKMSLSGTITSRPYIEMTASLLRKIGVDVSFEYDTIEVKPIEEVRKKCLTVESDWSSASYYYSIIALSDPGTKLTLRSFSRDSLQGDSLLPLLFEPFGVATAFSGDAITLTKTASELQQFETDLIDTPDLAQTIAVTAYGLGIKCLLTGLHTLRIKETDRLAALKTELEKLGAEVSVTHNSIEVIPLQLNSDIEITTYGDHRMAMAFAPLAMLIPLTIEDAGVVSKSYPAFWDDLSRLGFRITARGN